MDNVKYMHSPSGHDLNRKVNFFLKIVHEDMISKCVYIIAAPNEPLLPILFPASAFLMKYTSIWPMRQTKIPATAGIFA